LDVLLEQARAANQFIQQLPCIHAGQLYLDTKILNRHEPLAPEQIGKTIRMSLCVPDAIPQLSFQKASCISIMETLIG
jgi:hypothetical protein